MNDLGLESLCRSNNQIPIYHFNHFNFIGSFTIIGEEWTNFRNKWTFVKNIIKQKYSKNLKPPIDSIVIGGFEWISINLSKSTLQHSLYSRHQKTTSNLLRINLKGILKFNEMWPLEGAKYDCT